MIVVPQKALKPGDIFYCYKEKEEHLLLFKFVVVNYAISKEKRESPFCVTADSYVAVQIEPLLEYNAYPIKFITIKFENAYKNKDRAIESYINTLKVERQKIENKIDTLTKKLSPQNQGENV